MSVDSAFGDVQRRYAQFLDRTRLDLVAFVALVAVLPLNQPQILVIHPELLWLGLPYLIVPMYAVVAGLFRDRENALWLLRGRSTWFVAIAAGCAVAGLNYLSVRFAGALVLGGGKPVAVDPSSFVWAVFAAPVIEELVFQAGLQTRLGGGTFAVIATAVAFTLFHAPFYYRLPNMLEMLSVSNLFVGFLALGVLRAWNGSFVALFVAHGTQNLLTYLHGS